MIDMNSSRFEPIDSKRSTTLMNSQTKRFIGKRENATDVSISSGGTQNLNQSLREQISMAYGAGS